jgi:hypothetical protein
MNAFEELLNEDEQLRQYHLLIRELRVVEPYLGEEPDQMTPTDDPRNEHALPQEPVDLPPGVDRVNKLLRDAANHFSIAFHEDNRLLFLGDLESKEIESVAAELGKKRRTHFYTTITAHHGTHWHNTLSNVHTVYAISSVGSHRIANLKHEYKGIARRSLVTYANGDIHLSAQHHPRAYRASWHDGAWWLWD